MKRKKENKMSNNFKAIQRFDEEMILYQKLYNLKLLSKKIKATNENFEYFNKKRNFIKLVIYDKKGRVYLEESGIKQFTFCEREVVQNDSVRETVRKVVCKLSKKVTIEELEPIAVLKEEFENNSKTIENLGLVVMVRIKLKPESKMEEQFYYVNETLMESISEVSNKEILKLFIKRFSNIVLYNNFEFQDKEIEVNKKYKSRYKFHNEIIKKYILTSRVKKKNKLINLMSEKAIGCSTFLDVSCGDNSLLFSLKYESNFEFIVANDISWSQIELIPVQEKVIFTNHNAITFPFKDNVFDFVYCSNTLHHIPNRENLINLLNSMLRVGKKIVIYEIENPKVVGGFPYYLNKYWYRGFLKDAGEEYLSFELFKEIIIEAYGGKAEINFSNFKNIQGNYMIAEVKKSKK